MSGKILRVLTLLAAAAIILGQLLYRKMTRRAPEKEEAEC